MIRKQILFFVLFISSLSVMAQQPVDSAGHKLDSLSNKEERTGVPVNNIKEKAYNDITKLSAKDYFTLLGSNIKQSFMKPFHMKGRDWKNLGIFSGVAIATGFADEPVQQAVLRLRNRSSTVRNVGSSITRFGGVYEVYTLAGFGAYGILFKNEKVKNTTLLATQAYITGGLAEAVLKTLAGRTRPSFYAVNQEAEPKFIGPFGNTSRDAAGKRSNSSFPSGHTTVAFAAATVFAKEYANRPFVPILAYSIAGLIGVSRITENKHWTTDVLVGAALGYLTGNQVVRNYHRFAKIKLAAKRKAQLSFNLRYDYGKMMAGLVYKL